MILQGPFTIWFINFTMCPDEKKSNQIIVEGKFVPVREPIGYRIQGNMTVLVSTTLDEVMRLLSNFVY